ncbi:MAG: hypothetical protein GYA59_09255 [Chloroflexi bacterium]|nr:hypothetical protein [Chloroflexota bacterium]
MSETQLPHLTCTQCNGELHPDEGQVFVTCPYCGATVYLDKSQVVFHWSLAPTLDADQAAAALRRWMSGSQTVKDLDQKARIIAQNFQYFPLWYFRWRADGREETLLRPAAATSITEINRLNLPAGDLQRYDPALDSQAETPSVPLEAAHQWLQQSHPGLEVRESALVHVPLYLFKYTYEGKTFTAVVEAATGSVLANLFPAKAEAPYLLAGGLTALVYLCLATLPLFGAAISGDGVSAAGVGMALILGLAAAPFLFAFAVWVASKV